jgi:hypothetical protein
MVAALDSESPIPPMVPSLTYSASAAMVVSMGVSLSIRANVKISIFFFPSRAATDASTLRFIQAGEPSGFRATRSKPPFTERRTLSASSGYCVKYRARRERLSVSLRGAVLSP